MAKKNKNKKNTNTNKGGPKLSKDVATVDQSERSSAETTAPVEGVLTPEIKALLAKSPSELTIKELRTVIKFKQGDKIVAGAKERGKAKLAKLRTYAIRQRAWADAQTERAVKSEGKAIVAEAALSGYEKKLGVEPMDQEAIDATLAELMAAGKVAQVSKIETEPLEGEVTAEATKEITESKEDESDG